MMKGKKLRHYDMQVEILEDLYNQVGAMDARDFFNGFIRQQNNIEAWRRKYEIHKMAEKFCNNVENWRSEE